MIIGLLKDATDTRVALVPETIPKLQGIGHEVQFESGAGESSFFGDERYTDVGAVVKTRAEILAGADMILSVRSPLVSEMSGLGSDTCVLAMFNPLVDTELVDQIKPLNIQAFSLDRIPRTTID